MSILQFTAIVTLMMSVMGAGWGFFIYIDDKKADKEWTELAQAKQVIDLRIVAKESRLRDIEAEMRDIDLRAQGHQAWPGDAARRADLAIQRQAILQELEKLK